MELSIEQKIQAATEPLLKRIACLQEDFKMMKVLVEQAVSSNKSQITPKNNQPQRIATQKSKNVSDKRTNRPQEEAGKLETNKNMKGAKNPIETKETKFEQSKKPKSELKKAATKEAKDVGKKVVLDSAIEQTIKNDPETSVNININNDSVMNETKEITEDQPHVAGAEQPLKDQGAIVNGGSAKQEDILQELSPIQDKNVSAEEENLMDKVNQEIQMMNKETIGENSPVQSEHQANPISVETPFVSQTQKSQSVDPALSKQNNEYKQAVNSTIVSDPTVETGNDSIEPMAVNPNNAEMKQTPLVIEKKEATVISKAQKKPTDKNFIPVKKEGAKPIKQIDQKVDKVKSLVQPKAKAETKVVPPPIVKAVKQPVNKQKAAIKSVANSAKKPQLKEIQMKSQQKNDPNVTAMNQQASQHLDKNQTSTNMQLQTMETLEM